MRKTLITFGVTAALLLVALTLTVLSPAQPASAAGAAWKPRPTAGCIPSTCKPPKCPTFTPISTPTP